MEQKTMLTDLPSGDGFLVTSKVRRCRGCAKCISSEPGMCSIDDELSCFLKDAMSITVLEIHTGISDSQFSMPMRKAMERLGNILQSYTDAGNNIPLDSESVDLESIEIRVHGSEKDDTFESYAEELLCKGPVKRISFFYE